MKKAKEKKQHISKSKKKPARKSDSFQDLISVAASEEFSHIGNQRKQNVRKKLFSDYSGENNESEIHGSSKIPRISNFKSNEKIDYSFDQPIEYQSEIRIVSNDDPQKELENREIRFNLLRDYTKRYENQNKVYRWSIYEWFYSLGDSFFLRDPEFLDYLERIGIINDYFTNNNNWENQKRNCKFTRKDWKKIRLKIGRPRRLSNRFLESERLKLDNYRSNLSTHRKKSQDFPPLLISGTHVLVKCHGQLKEGTIESVDDRGYLVKLIETNNNIFANEFDVLEFEFKKPTPVNINDNNADPLNTLALAAIVSPRHNGDVRLLVSVIELLKTKEHLTQLLHELNNQAEVMKNSSEAYPADFQEKYAKHILSIQKTAASLKPLLIKLRESQENSPYRSLPKRVAKK